MRPSKVTTRVDSEIKASQVRLIGAEGEQVGIVSIREALQKAEEAGLNLVEISPNAEPPVCRIMDYGKYVFQLKKRKAMASKKQKQIQVKEIKLRPVTEEGDYQVKLRNLIRFLEEGNKAKVVLRFRGREFSHQELGVRVMQRLLSDLSPYGVVEQHPRLEGKQMVMILNPKKK